MTQPRLSPRVQLAVDFLKEHLKRSTRRPSPYLPSTAHLADRAGVSLVTMHRAVQVLKKQGVIHGDKHQRPRIVPPERTPNAEPKPTGRAQISARVERDILSGAFGLHGKLPQLKELQSRYGVCYRTMRSILSELVENGMIAPSGKGFEMSPVSPRSSRRRIVLITSTGYIDQESALNHEQNRIITLFENECARLGFALDVVEIDFYNSLESRRAVLKLADSEMVAGYVIDMWWHTSKTFQAATLDMLDRLCSFGKPVAVLDEFGNFDLPVRLTQNPLVQVYTIESVAAARRVARHLISLGHTPILYVSSVHHSPWSRARFEGLKEQYAEAGLRDAVRLVTRTGARGDLPYLLTACGLSDEHVRKLIAVGRTPAQASDLEERWKKFRRNNRPPYPGCIPLGPEILEPSANIARMHDFQADTKFLGAVCNAALHEIGSRHFDIDQTQLMELAFAHKDATAWVCATDGSAYKALEFLHTRGVRVPGQISVVGFDNIPVVSLERRLTTIDFNAMGFVQRMISFVLRPPRPRGRYRHRTVEVESIVMERETSAKARSAGVVK